MRNLSNTVEDLSAPPDLTLFEEDKWEKKILTWRVTKFSSQEMPEELVNEALRRAFYVWERHADLTFEWQEDGVPDLEIRWEVGDHGDGDAFDGSGGTLAHAFFPQVHDKLPIFTNICPYSPIIVNFHQSSPISSNSRQYFPVFTNIRQYSPILTNICQFSSIFTNIFQYSPIFTNIHKYSSLFANIHQYSPIFTNIHQY